MFDALVSTDAAIGVTYMATRPAGALFPRTVKLHSKRVEKMNKYTRNEWRRSITTLETSGEDD
jgi:hypothetical protein